MATNGKNNIEKRLAFLEKVYINDRARWQKSEENMISILKILKRHDEEIKKQGERLDSIIKIILRKLEE